MILKFKMNGVWRIIDGISQVDVMSDEYVKGSCCEKTIASITYVKNGVAMGQDFGSEAYLLNDEGKTIQRLTSIISG